MIPKVSCLAVKRSTALLFNYLPGNIMDKDESGDNIDNSHVFGRRNIKFRKRYSASTVSFIISKSLC